MKRCTEHADLPVRRAQNSSSRLAGSILVAIIILLAPPPARGDWFLVPAAGLSFASDTNLVDLERAAGGTKVSLHAAVLWLSDGWLGLDGEVSYIPGFFDSEDQDATARLVTKSSVTTVMGSVVIAAPLNLTGNSLRPYAIAGFGLIRASTRDLLGAFPLDEKLMGLRIGGGAMGPLTDTIGVRWEVSRVRTLKGQSGESGVTFGSRSLSLWRATLGFTFRF